MSFFQIYILAFAVIMIMMITLWIISVIRENVSIVDIFWGFGFVLVSIVYFLLGEGNGTRKILVLLLSSVWGLRLTVYIAWRNYGKDEDFRYRQFRENYGENRYWWVSFFQTFLLQGFLMWLISAPLLGAQFYGYDKPMNILDWIGIFFWVTGIVFETGGDWQLARFKTKPGNKDKVLDTGFWRYTRHPNYFGDASAWWGYGFLCLAAGSWLPALGSVLMTILIIKVSGVTMLEKTLKWKKPQYREYIEKTSAFFPWFPKKK